MNDQKITREPSKTENKVWNLFRLMERLANGETLYPQSTELQDALNLTGTPEAKERKLRRYLNEIRDKYYNIVRTEKVKMPDISRKPIEGYKVPNKERDIHEVLEFFLEYGEDLDWLLQIVHENDPKLLQDLSDEAKERLKRTIDEDENIYLFVSYPFERTNGAMRQHMRDLKRAVKAREYRRIVHRHRGELRDDIVACLRLIFSDGNWYLAAENVDESLSDEDRFMLVRLSFVRDIDYVRDAEGHPDERYIEYPEKLLEKYREFFPRIQNAMTLYRPFDTARIQASPTIAPYFKEGAKRFFPSQRFACENEDGSVEFTLEYTQPLEILPFIKRWAPNLTVLEPAELRHEMQDAMRLALERHEGD